MTQNQHGGNERFWLDTQPNLSCQNLMIALSLLVNYTVSQLDLIFLISRESKKNVSMLIANDDIRIVMSEEQVVASVKKVNPQKTAAPDCVNGKALKK